MILFIFAALRSGLLAAFVAVALAAAFSGMKAVATGMAIVVIISIAVALVALISRVAVTVTVAASVVAASFVTFVMVRSGTGVAAVLCSTSMTVANAILALYFSRQALAFDPKYGFIRAIAIAFGADGGTSFCNANLTDTNFTAAILKNTNFTGAILTRTCFLQAAFLRFSRFDMTYLERPQVQQLLTTKIGIGKNFDGLNLWGVNLRGASLVDASFVATNLSEANLQDADLSRANLKQTQLDGTDFTGATLTGAFIEDWNITSDTKFNGVRCEYVYMRLPTKENPDPCRKPDNNKEVFADGDFGDFIQPIFDTLDLYHAQGVDPRAIAISFRQLTENNPHAELRIVGMEARGEDKFLLRAKTGATADKSELSAEYFDTYNQLKALPEREIKLLLAEKDSRIRSLETMVVTALERPGFYAETYNNQGDTMPQSPKKQSTFNLQNAQFGGGLVDGETVNAHQIGGNITNNAQEQPTETKNIDAKTILILAANPKTTSRLRLDEEVREIDAGLQRAKKRELFDLQQRWAVRVQDVYQSLLDFKPQIVHFSGHGAGDDGLELEDETGKMKLVSTEALTKLFELFASNVECVVLNACYSEIQASAIAQHIPYVIGMNKEIGDKAAIKFATGFYSALGAGESVEFAYKLGCNVIQLDGIAEHLTPVLKKK
ncbi:MAG: pentapeptide repeat-containing protein [Hassallia sp.]